MGQRKTENEKDLQQLNCGGIAESQWNRTREGILTKDSSVTETWRSFVRVFFSLKSPTRRHAISFLEESVSHFKQRRLDGNRQGADQSTLLHNSGWVWGLISEMAGPGRAKYWNCKNVWMLALTINLGFQRAALRVKMAC